MKKLLIIFLITFMIFSALVCTRYFFPKPPLLNTVSFSKAFYDENHKLLRLTLTEDSKYRLYTPLAHISPVMREATLMQEDQYFYWHVGFNPIAFGRAFWASYIKRSRLMGASTITMQVARLLYRIPPKTWRGKLLQLGYAIKLELFYSKAQILEAYLNLAPYGGNIEGVGAASLVYFHKPASVLNLPEACTLSVIPQNPTLRAPFLSDTTALQQARLRLFKRFIKTYPQYRAQENLLHLPLVFTRNTLPFLAPHFVERILSASEKKSVIVTTLNVSLQSTIEKTLRAYLTKYQQKGFNNAAILLVDTRDMGVKALVGSGDYFNKTIQGQINGTAVKLSPGSTLKPFIYALALDQGLIHPFTILKDVPSHFSGYTPENFDADFMGPIKAKDALITSRNIPAIYLAEHLKNPTLYQFLQEAGVSQLKSSSSYGLSLVLGSVGITMEELARLYAMLANGGVLQPLRFQTDNHSPVSNVSKGKSLLSPEAAFLTLDMLKDTPRPYTVPVTAKNQLPVYWKTGTSSGYHDAWSAGIVGPYVLVVWVGNFEGKSSTMFIGTEAAAPLFFDIIEALTASGVALPAPEIIRAANALHLARINVCEASGLLPTRYCSQQITTWFIPGKSPITRDTIYREVAIDPETGLRTCHIDKNTRFEIYEFWPSDLLALYAKAGIQRKTPPAFDGTCDLTGTTNNGLSPVISSPETGLTYLVRSSHPNDSEIVFTATADADVRKLFWFIDKNFIGQVNRDTPLLWRAIPGDYTVRVVDDHGRAASMALSVKAVN